MRCARKDKGRVFDEALHFWILMHHCLIDFNLAKEGHKTFFLGMTFFSRGRNKNISKRRPLILSLTKSLQIGIQFSKAKSDGIGLRLLLSKHPIVTDGEIKFDGATIHRCQLEPRIIKMGGNLCKVLIYIEFKSA